MKEIGLWGGYAIINQITVWLFAQVRHWYDLPHLIWEPMHAPMMVKMKELINVSLPVD